MLSLRAVPFGAPLIDCGSPDLATSDGHWIGRGRTLLGAPNTPIRYPDLVAYLVSLRPTIQAPIVAYDLACAVPVSVSAMWAHNAKKRTLQAIERASADAAEHALGYLEQHAPVTTRGTEWVRQIGIQGGLIGVRYQHYRTRAGDPDLHEHVILLNLAKGDDDQWGVLGATVLRAYESAASEHHTSQLVRQIEHDAGLHFSPQPAPRTGRESWELDIVDERLRTFWNRPSTARDRAVTR